MHGVGCAGSIAVFKFETVAFSINREEEIEFGACMGGPEIGCSYLKVTHDLVEGKPFPGGS